MDKIIAAGLAVGLLYTGLQSSAFGWLDGQISPVTTELKIDDFRENKPQEALDVIATGTILRAESCSWRKTEWYLGTPDKSAFVKFGYYDKPQLRDNGDHTWRFWIRLSKRDLLDNSYALVYHQCYGGWTADTITTHYIGKGATQ